MNDEFDPLGSAERMIAKQIRDAIEQSRKGLSALTISLDEVDLDGIEDAMLDPKRRDAVVNIAEVINKLPSRISELGLVAVLVKVMLTPQKAGV